MLKVSDLMTSPSVNIHQDASLGAAALLMLEKGFGSLPVVDDSGMLIGLVTESSFAAKSVGMPFSVFRAPQVLGKWLSDDRIDEIYEAARSILVRDIMVKTVVTISENEPAARAVELMLEHDINRIPVVRDGRPIGIVARHDLLRMVVEKGAKI